MKGKNRALAFFVIMVGMTCTASAQVVISPQFTGTLIVTLPDGEVSLYESGDPLPQIPNNATVEVFDGSISIQTGPGDTIQVGCFGNSQSIGNGSTAELTCGADSGMLTVDGQEYPITGDQTIAEPTADSDPTGVPTDTDPVPDSRSIQASIVS